MTFAERLRMYRKQANLTQKELGIKSGCAEINIRQYEAGKYTPKSEAGKRIADALGISISDLYGWSENWKSSTNISLNEKLKRLRLQKGFTQKELAEKIGTLESSYRGIELGKRKPKIETVRKLASVLEVTVSDLYGWSDEESTEKKSGEWVNYCCSVCGISKYNFFTVVHPDSKPFGTWKYCPNCGSKMKVNQNG